MATNGAEVVPTYHITTLLLIRLFSRNNQVLEIVLMLHITYGLVPIDPRSYYYKDSVPFINFKIEHQNRFRCAMYASQYDMLIE